MTTQQSARSSTIMEVSRTIKRGAMANATHSILMPAGAPSKTKLAAGTNVGSTTLKERSALTVSRARTRLSKQKRTPTKIQIPTQIETSTGSKTPTPTSIRTRNRIPTIQVTRGNTNNKRTHNQWMLMDTAIKIHGMAKYHPLQSNKHAQG